MNYKTWPLDWLKDETHSLAYWIESQRDWINWIDGCLRYGMKVNTEYAPDSYFGKMGFKNTEELLENHFLPEAHNQIREYEKQIREIREIIIFREMNEVEK